MPKETTMYDCAVEIREQIRELDSTLEVRLNDIADALALVPCRRDLFAAFFMHQLMSRIGLFPIDVNSLSANKREMIAKSAWELADLMVAADPMPKIPSPENK